MEDIVKNVDQPEPKGLAAFFSYIDSDELLATVEYLHMPTLVRQVTEVG